ncbi:Ig-like domain repeat protein [Nocardioides sp. YIM 152315]|uniref:Ig-like domain repeat protein n=1 Tax=Nocardioides sp. YIM 152315 TaxID=3031760 RepID=UPI0023DA41F2|nr:Ig-like domain repeat protein [Nocardioides sp. YIM 152315]MDF1606378.1 Ig-like domain repeat protein [Nocardioides sp. YIM 152315]
MNLRRLTARTAVAGIATTLAAGALVAGGAGTASAATVTNTYNCTVAALGASFDTVLTATGGAPAEAPAGWTVPAGTLKLQATAVVSDPAIQQALKDFAVSNARSDDFALELGKGDAPIPLSGAVTSDGTTTTWSATGANKKFVTPAAGKVNALLPAEFTFTAETASLGDVPIPCELKAGQSAQSLGEVALAKQKTKTKAKSTSVKAGKVAKLTVKVKGNAGPATSGKVVVKEGKKVLGKAKVKNGKAKVKLGKLGKGKHKVTVSFAGGGSFKSSKDKAVVKVK